MLTVSPDLLDAKRKEVQHRGLMSYPVDSSDDQVKQQEIEAYLSALPEATFIQSPSVPLRMHIDRSTCPKMVYYFSIGDYEQGDMDMLMRHLKRGDIVVEFGGGVGLTGSLAGLVTQAPVWVFEPNQALHPAIRANAKLNGADLRLEPYAVVSLLHDQPTIEIAISRDYWWSSISNPPAGADYVEVPCKRFDEIITDKKPTAAILDIEGYEVPLFAAISPEDLGSLETLFIEIHAPTIGVKPSCALFNQLYALGFEMVDFAGLSFVFKRSPIRGYRGEGRWY